MTGICLRLIKKRIEKFDNGLIRPEREQIVKLDMISQYMDGVIATYSKGGNSKEMLSYFVPVVDLIEKFWFERIKLTHKRQLLNQYGLSNYFQMLTILSVGYLLDVSESHFEKIAKAIERDGVYDLIYSFIISKKLSEFSTSLQESYEGVFIIPELYTLLREAITEENKEKSAALIDEFITQKWYAGLSKAGVGYVERHDSKSDSYNGYWCFEAAAVVKIKGLDDSSFRDHPYYPADLVHGMDEPPKKKKGFFGW
ncbi:MAG: PoNe immunity protein domain-containing protein [Bacteroidota bacterium]